MSVVTEGYHEATDKICSHGGGPGNRCGHSRMDCTGGIRVKRLGQRAVDGQPPLECAQRVALGSGMVNGVPGGCGMKCTAILDGAQRLLVRKNIIST